MSAILALVALAVHVAGTVGDNSGGYYTGVAPGSDLIGIATGDTLLIFCALEGFDYALQNHEEYDIRVSLATTSTIRTSPRRM